MKTTKFAPVEAASFPDQLFRKELHLEQFELLTKSGTWEWNLDTDTLLWSDGVFHMLGFVPREFDVSVERWLSVVYPEDRKAVVQYIEEAGSLEWTSSLKKRLVRKDGKTVTVLSKANLIIHPESDQKILIGVFQNISEFPQAEENFSTKINGTLLHNLDGIFWEADAKTFEFTYISPQIERITGFSDVEWMATSDFWQTHIHPSDRENAIQTCHLEIQNLSDHSFNYRFLTKEGKIIWLNDRVKVIAKDGKPHTIQGMMVDITQEKEKEQALQAEISLNRSLIQQLPSVFFIFDTTGKFQHWNRQLETVSGYSSDEISKMSPEEFFTFKDHSIFDSHLYKLIGEGQMDVELALISKAGKRISFLFSVSRLMYHGQLCIFGIGQDISELVESRKSTAQHIERFQKVTQATSDAIWDYDIVKNSLYWGEGFLTLFGYDPALADPTLEYLLSLIHPEDRVRVIQLIQSYLSPTSTKNDWLEEYRFLKSDGTYADVLDKAIFIRNEEGEVSRVVGAMQDISKQKENEKSLRSLNEELEKNVEMLANSNLELQQFAFVASHDLQEPLRMISGFMGLLERKYSNVLDAKALEYISFATNGASQMKKIILDLLELSRVGKTTENKTKLEIGDLVQEISQYLKNQILEKNVTIKTNNLPVVDSYKTPLFQIFQNLIGNAIKFARADVASLITVSCRELPDFWEFSVEDNGIGIDPDYFKKVFVIFQRLHVQQEYEGTGIGLAIVKKSVEFLEGQIHLESQRGVGSKFTFTVKK